MGNTSDYEDIVDSELDCDLPNMPESPDLNLERPGQPSKIGEFQTVTLQEIQQFAEDLD